MARSAVLPTGDDEGDSGLQLVVPERLPDYRRRAKLQGNHRQILVARHDDEGNLAPLEDRADRGAKAFAQLHIHEGAVQGAFPSQLTGLPQPGSRADRFHPPVAQAIADHFGQQEVVFDDEDLTPVPLTVVSQTSIPQNPKTVWAWRDAPSISHKLLFVSAVTIYGRSVRFSCRPASAHLLATNSGAQPPGGVVGTLRSKPPLPSCAQAFLWHRSRPEEPLDHGAPSEACPELCSFGRSRRAMQPNAVGRIPHAKEQEQGVEMLYTPLFLQTRAIRSRKQAQKARRLASSITTNDVARRLNWFAADLLDGKATADELEAAALEALQQLNDSAADAGFLSSSAVT